MALFHLSVTQTKRSAGQSAIASAAYRAGERLYSEYYGEYSDYTRKGGVICSDILLPSHAPPEYADRQTLWNAVEKAERGKNAQLAYSFDIALQNEFSLEENIALARQFLLENFVSRGMVVDFAVHQPDREDGGIPNPHFHVLCPIRPIEQNGKWGLKQRRVYELDEDGNRIRDANGKFVFNAVPTTDWGSPETLEYWRQTWAELCNGKFAEKGLDVRIDHRSYERQGVELLPTVHEGATVRAMEKKGIRTEKGEFNRWIKATNAVIRDIKKKIALLFDWIAEAKAELAKPQAPDLVSLLNAYYTQRRAGAYSQKGKISNLKEMRKKRKKNCPKQATRLRNPPQSPRRSLPKNPPQNPRRSLPKNPPRNRRSSLRKNQPPNRRSNPRKNQQPSQHSSLRKRLLLSRPQRPRKNLWSIRRNCLM